MHLVAVDAGGSSTRAVVFDATGRCLGLGTAGSANPISSGPGGVARSLGEAVRHASVSAAVPTSSISHVVVAMAGSRAGQAAAGPEHGEIAAGLSAAGVAASFVVESDLLAMFCAGSSALGGYAMVAGTGAAAIRVRDGEVDAVADGAGWLLGDDGSGFWIGQRVARGVVAALDGRSPSTGMTPLVLARLGIGGTDAQGRSPLNQLTSIVYSMRPVELAQLAPVAFGLDDDLARGIVSDAAEALVRTLAAVVDDRTDGPLVLGGSVLLHQATVGAGVESFFRSRGGDEVVRVVDGVLGAAVLALRRRGTDVDSEVFTRVRDSLAALRER